MSLLDVPSLVRLQDELCVSMKRLLSDLCLDLATHYADLANALTVPVGYFRFLGQALGRDRYAHGRVVGWIEALNDFVYFMDLLQQIRAEPDPCEFSAQLLAECDEQFFENSYREDLFPGGVSRPAGLERRLTQLCMRLTQELTQESLSLVPGLPMRWCEVQKIASWSVLVNLSDNFERAEMAGTLAVGLESSSYTEPAWVKHAGKHASNQATLHIQPFEMFVKIHRLVRPLCSRDTDRVKWSWQSQPLLVVAGRGSRSVTVGPTLVYGQHRQPQKITRTSAAQVVRIKRAWTTIQAAWPEGSEVLSLLTVRIIPLKAKEVVSFSYRHRPGLSFINCYDRDNLDLIDDVLHENSHHQLNLLLRKQILYQGDRNQQIFYSPWRRGLRPLRGIVHAAFTFTMGAMLFERLSMWASGPGGLTRWHHAGLTPRDLQRARVRGFEEIASVRYSIQDLQYASGHLKWLTGSGRRVVKQLAEAIAQVERHLAPYRSAVLASPFGPALRRHEYELQRARQTYGPVRLDPS